MSNNPDGPELSDKEKRQKRIEDLTKKLSLKREGVNVRLPGILQGAKGDEILKQDHYMLSQKQLYFIRRMQFKKHFDKLTQNTSSKIEKPGKINKPLFNSVVENWIAEVESTRSLADHSNIENEPYNAIDTIAMALEQLAQKDNLEQTDLESFIQKCKFYSNLRNDDVDDIISKLTQFTVAPSEVRILSHHTHPDIFEPDGPQIVLGDKGEVIVFNELAELGHGVYGSVYLGQSLDTGDFCVVKKLHDTSQTGQVEFNIEKVNLENLDRYIDGVTTSSQLISAQELAWGRDYMSVLGIKEGKQNQTHLEQRLDMLIQAIEAIKQLHDTPTKDAPFGHLHRDIKADNIMWDERTQTAKIIDVGVSTAKDKSGVAPVRGSTLAGAPTIWAPELLANAHTNGNNTRFYSEKTEVYAIGVLAYAMFSNDNIYQADLSNPASPHSKGVPNHFKHGNSIFNKPNLSLQEKLIYNEIEKMLDFDSNNRPNLSEALTHLKEINQKLKENVRVHQTPQEMQRVKPKQSIKSESQAKVLPPQDEKKLRLRNFESTFGDFPHQLLDLSLLPEDIKRVIKSDQEVYSALQSQYVETGSVSFIVENIKRLEKEGHIPSSKSKDLLFKAYSLDPRYLCLMAIEKALIKVHANSFPFESELRAKARGKDNFSALKCLAKEIAFASPESDLDINRIAETLLNHPDKITHRIPLKQKECEMLGRLLTNNNLLLLANIEAPQAAKKAFSSLNNHYVDKVREKLFSDALEKVVELKHPNSPIHQDFLNQVRQNYLANGDKGLLIQTFSNRATINGMSYEFTRLVDRLPNPKIDFNQITKNYKQSTFDLSNSNRKIICNRLAEFESRSSEALKLKVNAPNSPGAMLLSMRNNNMNDEKYRDEKREMVVEALIRISSDLNKIVSSEDMPIVKQDIYSFYQDLERIHLKNDQINLRHNYYERRYHGEYINLLRDVSIIAKQISDTLGLDSQRMHLSCDNLTKEDVQVILNRFEFVCGFLLRDLNKTADATQSNPIKTSINHLLDQIKEMQKNGENVDIPQQLSELQKHISRGLSTLDKMSSNHLAQPAIKELISMQNETQNYFDNSLKYRVTQTNQTNQTVSHKNK